MKLGKEKILEIMQNVIFQDDEEYRTFENHMKGLLWRGPINHIDFIKFLEAHFTLGLIDEFKTAINNMLEKEFCAIRSISGYNIRGDEVPSNEEDIKKALHGELDLLIPQLYNEITAEGYNVHDICNLSLYLKGRVYCDPELFKKFLKKASKRFEDLPEWQKNLLEEQVGIKGNKSNNKED